MIVLATAVSVSKAGITSTHQRSILLHHDPRTSRDVDYSYSKVSSQADYESDTHGNDDSSPQAAIHLFFLLIQTRVDDTALITAVSYVVRDSKNDAVVVSLAVPVCIYGPGKNTGTIDSGNRHYSAHCHTFFYVIPSVPSDFTGTTYIAGINRHCM